MKAFKRAASCFAALLILLPVFSSCSGNSAVLSYGSQSVSKRLFSYALMLTKTQALSALSGSSTSLTDDAAIWSTAAENGKTYGQIVWDETLETLTLMLFYCDYAKKNNLSLSSDEKTSVQEQVTGIVNYFSSEAEFRSYMSQYDIDAALLKEYYTMNALSNVGMKAYYSAAGTSLTEADCKAYYKENYVTCLFVYYNLTNRTLENGKTVLLTEGQKAEKQALLDAARTGLSEGKPLSDYLSKSDDSSFSDGAALTFERSALSSDALEGALFSMEENEQKELSADGGIYLLQKDALSETYYKENLETILLAVKEIREAALLETIADSVSKKDSVLSSFSVETAPIFAS